MAKRRRRKGRAEGGLLARSAEMVGWALGGLEREIAATRERLAALTAQAGQLRGRLGRLQGTARNPAASAAAGIPPAATRRKRRKMSAEARKRISEAMTRRWAERRRGKTGRKGQA
jgi:hypothetical protein